MNENQIILILLVIIIFTILVLLGLLDIYNERKHKLQHQVKLKQIQNEINQYKNKYKEAKVENAKIDAKLKRIKISNDELKM